MESKCNVFSGLRDVNLTDLNNFPRIRHSKVSKMMMDCPLMISDRHE